MATTLKSFAFRVEMWRETSDGDREHCAVPIGVLAADEELARRTVLELVVYKREHAWAKRLTRVV